MVVIEWIYTHKLASPKRERRWVTIKVSGSGVPLMAALEGAMQNIRRFLEERGELNLDEVREVCSDSPINCAVMISSGLAFNQIKQFAAPQYTEKLQFRGPWYDPYASPVPCPFCLAWKERSQKNGLPASWRTGYCGRHMPIEFLRAALGANIKRQGPFKIEPDYVELNVRTNKHEGGARVWIFEGRGEAWCDVSGCHGKYWWHRAYPMSMYGLRSAYSELLLVVLAWLQEIYYYANGGPDGNSWDVEIV